MGMFGLLFFAEGFDIVPGGGFKVCGGDGSGIGAIQLGAHDGFAPGPLKKVPHEPGVGEVTVGQGVEIGRASSRERVYVLV